MMRRWTREARLSLARLPGLGRAPDMPAHTFRDLWPGDATRGALMLRGVFRFDMRDYPLTVQDWEHKDLPVAVRRWLHGFTWLRDLRALGNDEARLQARAIVASWIDHLPTDPLIADAATTGERLAAWMGHFDFFAASADMVYRQRLMDRLLIEGRTIAALLPLPVQGWRGLSALRGLLAAALSIPSQSGFFSRFLRYLEQELDRLMLPDGCLADRSPEAQFQAVRELVEMSAMLRAAQIPPPPPLSAGLARLCPVLRAMRHGDGGLALFNGASVHDGQTVETMLNLGARQKIVASAMPDGGFYRIVNGKSLLIVDGGMPPPPGFDATAQAGTLSFEFSHGRQRVFVNCGSARTGAWAKALRATAAHTSLTLDNRSCIDFSPGGGVARRPGKVTATHLAQDGAHWLDLSHDGYRAPLGANWRRRLYLGRDGQELRGEETVEGERRVQMVLRFHIHPDISAQISDDQDEVLLTIDGAFWRFRQEGGTLALEESVYLGDGDAVPALQIVVTAPSPDAAAVAEEEKEEEAVGETPASPRKPAAVERPFHHVVQWVFERAPD